MADPVALPILTVVVRALALVAAVRQGHSPEREQRLDGTDDAPRRQGAGGERRHVVGVNTGYAVFPNPGALQTTARVDLFWLPLGAGASVPVVRWNGLLFEALAARRQHRRRADLYHAALQVHLDDKRFVVELAPAWGAGLADHGVVLSGPVGFRWLGRTRYFRYEVRRWCNGTIPDISWAVGGPRCVANDEVRTRRVLELVSDFPTATWGRDELGTGDMWNSNSLIAWTLSRSGIDTDALEPPSGGRAPGWSAGLVVAARQRHTSSEQRADDHV